MDLQENNLPRIDVALSCDERYFPGLLGTVSSLLASADLSYHYVFHILDGGITASSVSKFKSVIKNFKHSAEVDFIQINTNEFSDFPAFFFDSKMAYARLLLPSLLKIDKVIYIDADILVLKDIAELWEMELQEHAAVCLETLICTIKNDCAIYEELGINGDAPHFNSGLMVMNLKKFRVDEIALKSFTYLKDYHEHCKIFDQSALNVILYNKVKYLDSSWNVQSHKKVFNPVLVLEKLKKFEINLHFVTKDKPWLFFYMQPEYQMFVRILEIVGFPLQNFETYTTDKRAYEFKLKFLNPLLAYYRAKMVFYRVLKNKNALDRLKNASAHWQNINKINAALHREQETIATLMYDWEIKIKTKMICNG
ncbi:glycosyltransferase family 8 protein [Mucilaginibacter gotjawali]|uniref:Lipopolysaccharide biosynthesis glycosyltransferase n=2 Tax=Mucilaginibacter gotjawali TaxID=1550579 RepID=A0A839SLU9_9SPHI|nr:glycosyltransferase family 8 protein [Mucilaginibacter gotjawali]MBB3057499.1 lipopolysaccharide biosynthesis glycosyltransferase [Mucilaginibacter gotjawali]BAU55381.1 General stress protein A [Mucilaginibacter gotjawali]